MKITTQRVFSWSNLKTRSARNQKARELKDLRRKLNREYWDTIEDIEKKKKSGKSTEIVDKTILKQDKKGNPIPDGKGGYQKEKVKVVGNNNFDPKAEKEAAAKKRDGLWKKAHEEEIKGASPKVKRVMKRKSRKPISERVKSLPKSAKIGGAVALGTGAVAGAAYAGKKIYDKSKEKELQDKNYHEALEAEARVNKRKVFSDNDEGNNVGYITGAGLALGGLGANVAGKRRISNKAAAANSKIQAELANGTAKAAAKATQSITDAVNNGTRELNSVTRRVNHNSRSLGDMISGEIEKRRTKRRVDKKIAEVTKEHLGPNSSTQREIENLNKIAAEKTRKVTAKAESATRNLKRGTRAAALVGGSLIAANAVNNYMKKRKEEK